MAAYPLTDLPKAYKIPAQQIDGIDAGLVHATISRGCGKNPRRRRAAVRRSSNGSLSRQRNQLAHHTGANRHSAGVGRQRRAGESPRVVSQQPIRCWCTFESWCRQVKLRDDEVATIERAVKTDIAAAVEFAINSPFPKAEEAERGFFA